MWRDAFGAFGAFGEWGRELSDQDFASALLEAGLDFDTPHAGTANANAAKGAVAPLSAKDTPRLTWSSQRAIETIQQQLASPSNTARIVKKIDFSICVFTQFNAQFDWANRLEVVAAFESLTNVRGVTIECSENWAEATPWRLPIQIGALQADEVATWFAERTQWQPPNWPFQYSVVSRQFDRFSIIVANASLDRIQSLFATAPPRMKANALIVNGIGDVDANAMYATLERIAVQWSLSGIALVKTALSSEDFAQGVHIAAMALTHNNALDEALREGFHGNVVLIGNESLLREARIATQLESLETKLAQLPKKSQLRMSARNVEMLARTPIAMSAPPDESPISRAIDQPVVVATASLRGAIAESAPTFAFVGESHEASALTELAASVREAAAVVAQHAAAVRHVQQQCLVRCVSKASDAPLEKISNGFAVSETVQLRIRIGVAADPAWQSSNVAFPDHELPQNESKHRLTVMLYEPNFVDPPQLRDIELPASGNSSEAQFEFVPKKRGAFEARATILHHGRILQTALVRAAVYESRELIPSDATIELIDETRVRNDWTSLDRRARFDLAFVCNRDEAHIPRLVGVSENKAWPIDLRSVDTTLKNISTLLTDAAHRIEDHDDGLDQGENPALLTSLAFEGRELFLNLLDEQLRNAAAGNNDLRVETVTHIQIVGTRTDELVPIEMIYDYELSPDAALPLPVCPSHRDALTNGKCSRECAGQKTPGKHVCPMGFWGVRKVIERHLFDGAKTPIDAAAVVRAEASRAHDQIAIRNRALIAWSKRAAKEKEKHPPKSVKPLLKTLKDKYKNPWIVANNWDEWHDEVKANAPTWLIAFPHNAGNGATRGLELRDSTVRTTGFSVFREGETEIDPLKNYYVRAPGKAPPLVFLLGCDTAGAIDDTGSHVTAFHRAGAAAIVSTVATVYGVHMLTVGHSIVASLLARVEKDGGANLGEVLRDAKRAALADSTPMALGIIAFGDADWRIV
jgi:hypothetical protein